MENIQDYKKQLLISEKSKKAIDEFRRANPDVYKKFKKYFHLRPCSNKITIVSTHPDRPMRGIKVGVTKLINTVEFLADCIKNDETINWNKIEKENYNSGKGFEKGGKDNKKANGNKEYPHQAEMINNLENNTKLKKLLCVKNLFFNASEVIFSRGRNEKRKKLDIVAHDGEGKVFFFEMKAPENKKDDPIKQVREYLEMYGKKGIKNKIFEEMLKNYPQGSITNINSYVGYGVIGYNNNPVFKEENLIDCTRY